MLPRTLFISLTLLFHSSFLYAGNWMSRLPDDAYVAALSIPGAHDAATGYGFSAWLGVFGNRYARTQDLDIAQQWHIGIRAFDLRPAVYKHYMNANHGIMPTRMRFDKVLQLLCDSLRTNPSEFIIIHLLHAADGDKVKNAYNARIQQLLHEERFKGCFINFKNDLKVRDMRGKILIISRNRYADTPIGGFFNLWTGTINWQRQTAGLITGDGNTSGKYCVQDFSSTHHEGGVKHKVQAINQMLDFSTRMKYTDPQEIRWVFNFASAYSKVESIFGRKISLSKGYRDNATYTHKAFLDYLATHPAGPTGIILMDFVGVDSSNGYSIQGGKLVDAIINNNFRYLKKVRLTVRHEEIVQ